MIMHGTHIWRWIAQTIENCQHRVWIASAYVTSRRLDMLSNHFQTSGLHKVLIVRWQLNDLINGASSLEAYNIARDNGWEFFINLNLHAKTYLFDDSCAIGSANLTDSGMQGVSPPGNREMLVTSADIASVKEWFLKLQNDSRMIDDELFRCIENEVLELSDDKSRIELDNVRYSASLLAELLPVKDLVIYTCDLFWTNNPEIIMNNIMDHDLSRDIEHDLSLLGIQNSSDLREISDKFIASKAFRWLLDTVETQAYFGELSSILHSTLNDDPAPFRKDVKLLLRNILAWTSLYGKEFFHIDQPNVSQRITRI